MSQRVLYRTSDGKVLSHGWVVFSPGAGEAVLVEGTDYSPAFVFDPPTRDYVWNWNGSTFVQGSAEPDPVPPFVQKPVGGYPAPGDLGSGTSISGKYLRGDSTWQTVSGGGGGTPGDTVASETSFGVSASAGVATEYSRADHTHGTPTNPVTAHEAAGDPHPQYALESALAAVATSGSASDLGTGTLPIARIADAAVTLAKLADLAQSLIIGRAAGAGTGVPTALTAAQVKTLLAIAAGDVSGLAAVATSGSASDLGTGTLPIARIADAAVTLAKLADLAQSTIIGRAAGAGTGVPTALSAAQVKTLLAIAAGDVSGLAAVATSGSASDLGTGTLPIARIADAAVTLAKQADLAQSTIVGRAAGAGTGVPTALTAAQATAILDAFTSSLKGLVPASGGGTSNFLRADGTWAAPAGGGGGGPVSVTSLSSDASANATTTGVEITDLQVTGLAAGRYCFKYWLRVRSTATATGVKFGVNFTGTHSVLIATMKTVGTGTSAVSGTADQANTAAQITEGFTCRAASTTAPNLGPSLGHDTQNVDVLYLIEGILICSASGDLELWHASETAASTQVMAGSAVTVVTQ